MFRIIDKKFGNTLSGNNLTHAYRFLICLMQISVSYIFTATFLIGLLMLKDRINLSLIVLGGSWAMFRTSSMLI